MIIFIHQEFLSSILPFKTNLQGRIATGLLQQRDIFPPFSNCAGAASKLETGECIIWCPGLIEVVVRVVEG